MRTRSWLDVSQCPLENLVDTPRGPVVDDHDDSELHTERKVHIDQLEPFIELRNEIDGTVQSNSCNRPAKRSELGAVNAKGWSAYNNP